VGGGYGGLFCGACVWQTSAGAEIVAEEDLGRVGWGDGGVAGGGLGVQLLDSDSGGAFAGDGSDWECCGADGGFAGVGVQAIGGGEGFGRIAAGAWRDFGSD